VWQYIGHPAGDGVVALAGIGATTLVVFCVLVFVQLSMNGDRHRRKDGDEAA